MPTPGPEPRTASWELIGQTERIASPLLKPSRLIYIGAAAFGEAKKQPTTLVSASPGYRYLQRRSTNRTIEHGMWRQTDSRPYLVRKISARSKSISYLALRTLLKHGLKSILKCPGY